MHREVVDVMFLDVEMGPSITIVVGNTEDIFCALSLIVNMELNCMVCAGFMAVWNYAKCKIAQKQRLKVNLDKRCNSYHSVRWMLLGSWRFIQLNWDVLKTHRWKTMSCKWLQFIRQDKVEELLQWAQIFSRYSMNVYTSILSIRINDGKRIAFTESFSDMMSMDRCNEQMVIILKQNAKWEWIEWSTQCLYSVSYQRELSKYCI